MKFLMPLLISLENISSDANKGTYPMNYSKCFCCGIDIQANFATQTGTVVYCNMCLEVSNECCGGL